MGYREKLAERVPPYLEPGEQLLVAFPATTGPSPWLMALGTIFVFLIKPRVIAVTDRGIVVLRGSRWSGVQPQEVLMRGPHAQLGEPKGVWWPFPLGEKTYVHRRFHSDVRRANELMAARPAAS